MRNRDEARSETPVPDEQLLLRALKLEERINPPLRRNAHEDVFAGRIVRTAGMGSQEGRQGPTPTGALSTFDDCQTELVFTAIRILLNAVVRRHRAQQEVGGCRVYPGQSTQPLQAKRLSGETQCFKELQCTVNRLDPTFRHVSLSGNWTLSKLLDM